MNFSIGFYSRRKEKLPIVIESISVHPILSGPVIACGIPITSFIIVAIVDSRLVCWHLHFINWDGGWWHFLPRADRPGIIVVILQTQRKFIITHLQCVHSFHLHSTSDLPRTLSTYSRYTIHTD